ncbi:MAG: hypothetical protein WKF67_05585 [Rubrobacteraceae bacterium]
MQETGTEKKFTLEEIQALIKDQNSQARKELDKLNAQGKSDSVSAFEAQGEMLGYRYLNRIFAQEAAK